MLARPEAPRRGLVNDCDGGRLDGIGLREYSTVKDWDLHRPEVIGCDLIDGSSQVFVRLGRVVLRLHDGPKAITKRDLCCKTHRFDARETPDAVQKLRVEERTSIAVVAARLNIYRHDQDVRGVE